ncbi:MAG: 5-formyltetrahydrofolate cyclo-ligase [Waddliaceae bacterium]
MMQEKKLLRTVWRQRRQELCRRRKEEAPLEAMTPLMAIVEQHRHVLSYASVADEFDTWGLNQRLAEMGKLLLPKAAGKHLNIFLVSHPAKQLAGNSWGILEPIPSMCQQIHAADTSFVLVPGLAFDALFHRLGYGKGYYDRFLSQLPASSLACGLGFKEQWSDQLLPSVTTDVPLQRLLLF